MCATYNKNILSLEVGNFLQSLLQALCYLALISVAVISNLETAKLDALVKIPALTLSPDPATVVLAA